MFPVRRIGEILSQLSSLRYPEQIPLTGWRMQKRAGESRPCPKCSTGTWTEIPADGIWGGHCEYYAFETEIQIPDCMAGQTVEFTLTTGRETEWDATNPQFSVYVDGVLRQGFDVNHNDIPLSDAAVPGEVHSLFLSAFTGTSNFHLNFHSTLRSVDRTIEKFYYDLLLPWQTLCLLEPDHPDYLELLPILNQAINLLDLRKPGSPAFYQSIQVAEQYLEETLYSKDRTPEASIACVGHTHIDVAWLWTLSVTEDKAVRSFSTVLELMRRYPEYIFMSSQPQLYQYVKRNAPEIYAQIRERIAEGRWEPEGSSFVEPDCNLSSGEALVRQILYGKRFFRQEFNKDCRILWLPDVFGYAAALPQILKKSGIDYFMTTKISWNECNKMPYDTFYWKGIDGTKILTHFSPTRDYIAANSTAHDEVDLQTFFTTYNGILNPSQMKGTWQRYQQKNLNKEVLSSFGFGDGGGGPTKQMLESQRRMARGIPGCPKAVPSTALAFFERLNNDLQGKQVPIWSGELYLEYHRGTYTSMARNKKWNRRAEFALTNVETEGLAVNHLCGLPYPNLQEQWEILMRNQFHDILPGSSIREVYEDSKREYTELFATTAALEQNYLQILANRVGQTIVWNPNGQTMSGFVTLSSPEGRHNVQKTADGKYLAWAECIPPKGYTILSDTSPATGALSITTNCAETPYAVIMFNEKGQITSWFDKQANRQLLQNGTCANVLMTYEDKPFQFDNWNLQDYYKEKFWPIDTLVSSTVLEQGPYRSAIRFQWKYQDSPVIETLYFYGNSPRVDIHFETDWQEDQLLLKALFPLDLNTTEATFEIQYGNVKRSTAVNTSWDLARFEVCHHKWMDVSEGGFGVSFLNDCKYGVSVEENVVGLSLLKCGRYPNPDADREHHDAVYSVMPHIGTWQEAETVKEAYLLNNPMQAVVGQGHPTLPSHWSAAAHNQRNIMVEAVKQAEDSNAQIIRLYEFENTRTQLTLKLPYSAKQIWLCSLMEDKQKLLCEHTDTVTLTVNPYEIITILAEGEPNS